MKYLVMETFKTYAILLDEHGRFVKSANMGYEVGETVENPILMLDEPLEHIEEEPEKETESKVKPLFSKKLVGVLTTIAAMLALFIGFNFYQNNFLAYSSIHMAINPEVEMILNKNGEVLDVEGTNADGKTLVEDYEPASDEKVDVANELVQRAIEMGFLSDGGRVAVSIDSPDQALLEQYETELKSGMSGQFEIRIEIFDASQPVPADETTTSANPSPPVNDDSGYDDSGYDDSAYEETTTQAPPPAETTTAAPPPVDDDSGYDDSAYDDDDDEDDDDDSDDDDDD